MTSSSGVGGAPVTGQETGDALRRWYDDPLKVWMVGLGLGSVCGVLAVFFALWVAGLTVVAR